MEHLTQEEVIETTEENVEEGKAKRDKADCSHRVIEKRRRDRINNSLLQLSKLIPIEKFNKKNSGKLEKAEILEVTVQYLIQQQQQQEEKKNENMLPANNKDGLKNQETYMIAFLHGFKECIADATKFFQEVEELDVSEGRCHRLIQHLKKQIQQYENNERTPSKGFADGRVWDGDDSKKSYNSNSVQNEPVNVHPTAQSENTKRKNDESSSGNTKKQKLETPGTEAQNPANQDLQSSNDLQSNSNAEPASRNFMPFMFPNVPFFPTFPFTGANGIPRYQAPQTSFPGYAFPQSAAQYMPLAFPQFPYMGMNFMSGFGMVNPANDQQQQNNGMTHPMNNGLPCNMRSNGIQNNMTNAVPNGVVNGMMNNFLPSMYTNGIHANLLAMRPRDSGYESSDRSSSKESRSETSPPSFSDDSCQSFVT